MPPSSGFDVVVVPDFSSPERARIFEARILFFLASWLENAGSARALPLHLACIGAPPPSVRALAARCRATVHVCEPLGLTGSLTANKLRGLEVPGNFERILMLDADVFILGDFSSLADLVPDGLTAARAGSKWVPEALWHRIYDHLALPLPAERSPLLRVEYGLLPTADLTRREFGQTTDLRRMLPYYNSGVFLAPRTCGLREAWADHLVRLAGLFSSGNGCREQVSPRTDTLSLWDKARRGAASVWQRSSGRRAKYPRSVTTCDQATFSTAVQQVRAGGVPFHHLPDAFHARRLHCQAGRLRLRDMKIYHATGFLRPAKGERWDLEKALEQGIGQWQGALREGGKRRGKEAEAEVDALEAGAFLRRLYREYLEPALNRDAYPAP